MNLLPITDKYLCAIFYDQCSVGHTQTNKQTDTPSPKGHLVHNNRVVNSHMGSMVGETPLTNVTCKSPWKSRRMGSSLVDEAGTRPDNRCFPMQNGLPAKAATNRKKKYGKPMTSVMGTNLSFWRFPRVITVHPRANSVPSWDF